MHAYRELTDGVLLTDSKGKPLVATERPAMAATSASVGQSPVAGDSVGAGAGAGPEELYSTSAAAWGISTVVFVRTLMGAPGMSMTGKWGPEVEGGSRWEWVP